MTEETDGVSIVSDCRVIAENLTELREATVPVHRVGVIDRSLFPLELIVSGKSEPGQVEFSYIDKPQYEDKNEFFQKISLGPFGGAIPKRCFEAQVNISVNGTPNRPETITGGIRLKEFLGEPVAPIGYEITLEV